MLSTRILTALVLVPLVLAGLFLLPPRAWSVVSLAAVAIAAGEWANLQRYGPPLRIVFIAGVLVIGLNLLFAPWSGFDRGWSTSTLAAVCVPATLFWLVAVPPWLRYRWQPRSKLATAVVGWVVLTAAWVAIAQLQARSAWLVLAAMAIVWIADTAAYFAGRRFGRNKLAPMISPGKTWEGVFGGVAAVALYALALVPFARDAGLQGEVSALAIAAWVGLAVALALISVGGDLFESLLKRQAGVKDSGTLLPGHGGILDRIDALLAAMPPAALLVTVFLR
jgi:phosphatidate cytidylyltransferase